MIHRFCQRALLLFLASETGAAALPEAEALSTSMSDRVYQVTRWTAERGLPENNVKALAQTRDGYLWVGTLSGLARFDGVAFKVFNHNNTPEMTHDAIDDLAADAKDTCLWIASQDELISFRDNRFHRYSAREGVSACGGQLWPARDGGVWFLPRADQIARAGNGDVKTWEMSAERRDKTVRALVEESPSTMLLVFPWTVYRLDLNTKSLATIGSPAEAGDCFAVFQDSARCFWVWAANGLWHGTDGLWTMALRERPGPGVQFERILRTSDGEVWVVQNQGGRSRLQRLVDGKLVPFSAPEYPPDADVTRILEDHEGNLWVGTTSGLLKLEPNRVRVYSRRDGLACDDTLAVTCGTDGAICVGTAEGISTIRDGTLRNLASPEPPYWFRVGVFLADRKNALWVGWKGHSLARFREDKWDTFSLPAEVGNTEYLKAINEDQQGRLWIGTGDGVFSQDGGHWTHYCTTNGLSNDDVRVIYQDSRGDMWFGTFGGGLNQLHEGRITSYKTANGEYNNHAWWIHEDVDGVFWVGTEDGLNRFVPPGAGAVPHGHSTESPSCFTFTTQQGLHENVINNIQEDDYGYLWLSGLRGIYRVARRELNEVAAGHTSEAHCIGYGEADGMLSGECNGGDNQPSGCKDLEGRIWFPTTQGVAVIDPKESHRSEVPPPVVIEEVKADEELIFPPRKCATRHQQPQREANQPDQAEGGGLGSRMETQNDKQRVRVKPGKAHVLEFQYTANTFIASERAQFRYRLRGAEDKWREATGQRTVRYVNLRPGTYQFDVIAANHHGVWSQDPASFPFALEPHFWQTWTFYVLCAVGTVGLGGLVQGYRLKWQHRLLKLEEQRALASERARIARDLHDDLGTALTGLALQLDVTRGEVKDNSAVVDRLSQTAEKARDLADRMREVVWTINPRCDTVSSVATFLEQQIAQFLQAAGLKVRLDFPEDIPATPLRAQARHQLALSVREALTNVIRHARATEVIVSLAIVKQHLVVEVKDNGCGFDPARNTGHGLGNMRTRMELVGGQFECASGAGLGTLLRFRLPLETPKHAKDSTR